MRYDFSRVDSHIPRMVPKPSGHHAGGQQRLGPEHGLGRLQAPNPTVCDNKSDVPWLMSLLEALSVIRALFQVRSWLRKLQKMSPALKQGPLSGVPFPEAGHLPPFSQCMHFSPQYKGTWKWSDLLSAIIFTRIDYSRAYQLGKKTSAGVRNFANMTTFRVESFSWLSHTSFGKNRRDGRVIPSERPGVVQRKASSRPQAWHGPRGPALEAILPQKRPSENQVGS